MSNYRELSQMIKTQKAQKETSAPVPVKTGGGEVARRTVRQTVRTGEGMLSTPYMQGRIEQLSEKKDLSWRAEQAEKRYQNYLKSEEYLTGKAKREAEALQRVRMAQAVGLSHEYLALVSGAKEDEKEKQLKAEAEQLRAQAEQYEKQTRMTGLMADIDNVAARAEQDLETYLSSEEYAARKLTRETEALKRIRMAQAAGMSPEYLGLVSYTEEDETEKELRTKAEYYRGLAISKQEQQMLTADLQELERWPEEDRQMLIQYALNRQNEFYGNLNPMTEQAMTSARYAVSPIMEKYGAQRVEEITESYIRNQNQLTAHNVAQAAQEGAGGGFGAALAHNAGSVAGNLLGAYTSPMGYLEEMVNRTGRYSTLDPNNAGMLPGTYAGAVRQGTAEKIEESGAGKVGSTLYQAGMSAVDNLARMVAGGGSGSLALAATGSFGQAVSQYSAQGATPLEATAMGIISGGLEVLTEKVSLDNLLADIDSPKGAMDILKSVLRSGGVEVTEEELSFLGSTLAEAAVLRENSGYNRRIAELMAYGLTSAQAKEQASLGVIEEAAMTAVQSFLSGGMMAGATAGYSNAVNAIQNRSQDKQLQQTVQDAAQQITQQAGDGAGSVSYLEGAQVSQEMADSVQRMAAATGRQIQVYNASDGEDGYYDPNTGILHISANSRNPVAQVIAHELTHSVEMAEDYKEIKSLVLKRIQEKVTNLEQLRQEKRAQYASHGVQLKNDADIDSEIVASYVAGNLLTNEQSITSLVQENPGLGQRIKNWLDDLMAKFGNENARERAFVRKTRDAYARALDQTGRTSLPTGSQTGSEAETGGTTGESGAQMDSLMEQMTGMYRSGDISEEEYDSFLESYNSYMEQQGADPMAREDARFRKQDEEQKNTANGGGAIQYSIASIDGQNEDYGIEKASPAAQVSSTISGGTRSTSSNAFGNSLAERDQSDKKRFSFSETDVNQKGDTHVPETADQEVTEAYEGKALSGDSEIYDYDFLTSLPDMEVTRVPGVESVRNESGKIDTAKVIRSGIENALSVGDERAGKLYVKNRYTGRELRVDVSTIRHGLNGNMSRLLTNARLGSVIGDVIHSAVPINALNDTAEGVEGTYAMAGYAVDEKGREFVAIITVEQRSGNVAGIDTYDVAHAVSGRQKRDERVDTKSQGVYPSANVSIISIKDLLTTVKHTHQSILSEDVLNHLGETRNPGGYYNGRAKFSFPEKTEQMAEAAESQTSGIDRESLNGKARDFLKSVERKLLNQISNSMGVPYHAKRDSLQPIIQEISDEFLRTGTVSQEKTDELFERAYAEGVVVDREFYDQYKHIKDHLRTNSVTISKQDQADIADFRDFRRRAWGTVRIVNEGGLPVDSAYQELQEMAPELFPDHITHPADQLQRMYDVGQSIAISEASLDSYYGEHAEEYKRWQKVDFESAIQDSMAELRTVKRYADDRIKQQDLGEEITLKQAEQLWASLKDARKEYQKVSAKNLLTSRDEMQVGRLLRGEVLLEHLEGEENFKSIKAVYEAKQGYEAINSQIARYRRQVRAKRLQEADGLLQTANEWKDKRTGIAYSRETMRRNVFDIVPDKDLANRIVETYFEPVHSAEAESTRFKTEYRDRVRALKLETKAQKGDLVSEAHAVQLLGEAMDNIRMIEKSRGRMKTRDGKTLTEWQAAVQDLWSENPGLDKEKIENAVKEFRKIYDELFAAMNRKRMENGYEPVNYRQGYFPHFQPGDGDGIMKYFGRALGIDVNVEALPTTINGLTHTFKPGIQWFGNAQERLGFNTAYDAVEGFDKYIEGVSSVIHQTENIQKLRALATQARYRTSDEGIRMQVDQVQADTRLTEEEKQMKIREIYEHGKSALSNFVVELDEYTNLLANKKSKYDRTMESFLGRKAYTVMKSVENKVGANMIAGNLSSAFTNFIPLTQAYGRIGTADMLKGMKDACKAVIRSSDDVVARSDFLTNRRGSDVLVKGWQEKLSGWLGAPMEFIDNFVSEAIVRASYYQNLRRGMSEQEAIHQADVFAASVMADRSKGAMPTLFESSNPLFKAFTQFQLEVNNQYSEIFKDIPREYQDKSKWMLASCFFKYFVGAFLWNKFEEWIKGRDSAMDPIGIAESFITDFREAGFGEAGANLAVNLLEELPFASALSMAGVEIDGGRVPVSSAMPDFAALWDSATDKDLSKAQRWKTATEEIQKPITYLLMPAGGNQAAKIWKGIDAFLEGGSYGLDKDGNEILQYPVYKDDGGDKFWSMVRSMVFGKSSLDTAQDWVKDGFDSLNKFETVVYQEMLEAGVKDRDAYALVDELRKVPLPEVEGGAQIRRKEQQEILRDSDISGEGRAIAFYGMVASDSEKEFMNELTDAGAAPGDVFEFVIDFKAAKALDNDERRGALRDVIVSSKLTEEEKTYAIRDVLGKNIVTEKGDLTQFGKFLYAQHEGMTTDEFMDLYAEGISIDSYLNLTDKGISSDGALKLARELGKINASDLSSTEKWSEQCDAIMAAKLSDTDKVAALEKVSYKSTGRMIRIGNDHGIEPSISLGLKRILPNFDENGNGSYTQKEVAAAIDAMSGSDAYFAATGGTTRLTNEQKAILWQLQNSSWKPAKNPFDKEVGQYIYDLVRAEIDADKTADNEGETETAKKKWTLEDAIMAQWAAK